MFWPFSKPDSELERAMATLDPFVTEALSGLAAQELNGDIERRGTRTLAECYVYGAVRYLASYDGMRSADTGMLLEQVLATHFKADHAEIGGCRELFSAVAAGDREQRFMTEGASALRRWLVNGDRTVGNHLRELLASVH